VSFLTCGVVAVCLQERASKQLPGPGQHFSFGAVKPWEEILPMLDEKEGEQQPDEAVLAHVAYCDRSCIMN
jgi:hypothetical protein